MEPSFSTIEQLAKSYGNTLTTTLWRMVEDRAPDQPAFGMVSIHPKHPEIGATDSGRRVRYFIRSEAFRRDFPKVTPEDAFAVLTEHSSWKRGGPVVDCEHQFEDSLGAPTTFRVESFSNTHALLTYATVR